MNAQQKIDKILSIKGIDLAEFAMECKIIPNTLTVALDRDSLSSAIIKKIHDRFGVRKEFLRDGVEPVFPANTEEKHAPVQNRSDNNGKSSDQMMADTFNKIAKDAGDYYIVPKTVFEGNYRFVPVEEYEIREQEMLMRERELERKNDELVRKDHQIQGMYDLFQLVMAGRAGKGGEDAKEKTAV